MPRIVNKSELAEILGVTERTLTTWQKQGLPIEIDGVRGQQNQYDTAVVIEWLIQRELEKRLGGGEAGEFYNYEAERARLTHHQANIAQMEEAVKRGQLIPADTVRHTWSQMIAKARAKLLAMPAKLALRLSAISDVTQVQAELQTAQYEALAELAAYDPKHYGIDPARAGDSDVVAAANADGQ